MKKWLLALIGAVGWFGLTGSTCTSTFNEADLQAADLKQDKAAVAEEKKDQEIGEQGGEGHEAVDEQIEGIDGGSGANF